MRYVLLIAGVMAAATTAEAATYNFVVDQTTYDLSAGQNAVKVYIEEVGTPSLITSGGGLFGGAFKVTRTSGSSAKILDLQYGPLFTDTASNTKTVTPTLASLTEAVISGGVGFDVAHPTWVYLGQIDLALDGGSTPATFVVERYGEGGDMPTAASPFTPIDDPAPGVASFTVVVPEPTSLSLLVAAGLLAKRRLRIRPFKNSLAPVAAPWRS